MDKKTGFFEEAPGRRSATRLVFITGSFYAMLMGAVVFLLNHNAAEVISVVGAISGVFGAFKVIQKPMEGKANGD